MSFGGQPDDENNTIILLDLPDFPQPSSFEELLENLRGDLWGLD